MWPLVQRRQQTTSHLSPSSSVLCCCLYLLSAVPGVRHPYLFIQLSSRYCFCHFFLCGFVVFTVVLELTGNAVNVIIVFSMHVPAISIFFFGSFSTNLMFSYYFYRCPQNSGANISKTQSFWSMKCLQYIIFTTPPTITDMGSQPTTSTTEPPHLLHLTENTHLLKHKISTVTAHNVYRPQECVSAAKFVS